MKRQEEKIEDRNKDRNKGCLQTRARQREDYWRNGEPTANVSASALKGWGAKRGRESNLQPIRVKDKKCNNKVIVLLPFSFWSWLLSVTSYIPETNAWSECLRKKCLEGLETREQEYLAFTQETPEKRTYARSQSARKAILYICILWCWVVCVRLTCQSHCLSFRTRNASSCSSVLVMISLE